MADLRKIVENLSELKVTEAAELAKMLEEEWGVEAAAPVAVAAAAPVEAVEEKTEFDVVLDSVGEKMINVIKAIREIDSSLGLAEAKALAGKSGEAIKTAVPKDEAEKMKKKLEDAGAKVTLK